jgi:hypothetical protein
MDIHGEYNRGTHIFHSNWENFWGNPQIKVVRICESAVLNLKRSNDLELGGYPHDLRNIHTSYVMYIHVKYIYINIYIYIHISTYTFHSIYTWFWITRGVPPLLEKLQICHLGSWFTTGLSVIFLGGYPWEPGNPKGTCSYLFRGNFSRNSSMVFACRFFCLVAKNYDNEFLHLSYSLVI